MENRLLSTDGNGSYSIVIVIVSYMYIGVITNIGHSIVNQQPCCNCFAFVTDTYLDMVNDCVVENGILIHKYSPYVKDKTIQPEVVSMRRSRVHHRHSQAA